MAAPGTWEILRFCFSGGGRSSLADGVAVLSAWCLTLAILFFTLFFGLLLEDGTYSSGVSARSSCPPLLWLYAGRSARFPATRASPTVLSGTLRGAARPYRRDRESNHRMRGSAELSVAIGACGVRLPRFATKALDADNGKFHLTVSYD